MLAVRPHTLTINLFNWPDANLKVSWVKFVGIRPTQIYYQLKKSLSMLKTRSMGVIHKMF